MYTGTLDKINTSAVFEIALVRQLSVGQVKSYNHILFAFEVATFRSTTDDSQNEHCQDHSSPSDT